ncbi:YybH family protein [Allomuricauda sp. R78024]|uniref:YybH family protein n=1 Tax=Allomuricauda sp. R78024 TaxID=3093867 RepID=UPI0037C587DD
MKNRGFNLLFLFTITLFPIAEVYGQNDDTPKTALTDFNDIQQEVFKVEKAFQQMTQEKGIATAFKFFAAENAALNRNGRLIEGQEEIYDFYNTPMYQKAAVDWNPDKIELSSSNDMAYTYGKYVWKIPNTEGELQEYRGIYLTIWKKQADNTWKYVWD